MAQLDPERNVQLSVLDRLIDYEPRDRVEAPLTRSQSVRLMKESVRRDLEWLLNTSRTIVDIPEAYKEVENSVFTFGLPDINSLRLSGPADEKRLLRTLETVISRFEPRLARIKVAAMQPLTKQAYALHFQIEALLLIDPAPEQISFDTVLEVSRGTYAVKGD